MPPDALAVKDTESGAVPPEVLSVAVTPQTERDTVLEETKFGFPLTVAVA